MWLCEIIRLNSGSAVCQTGRRFDRALLGRICRGRDRSRSRVLSIGQESGLWGHRKRMIRTQWRHSGRAGARRWSANQRGRCRIRPILFEIDYPCDARIRSHFRHRRRREIGGVRTAQVQTDCRVHIRGAAQRSFGLAGWDLCISHDLNTWSRKGVQCGMWLSPNEVLFDGSDLILNTCGQPRV